jgi:hypothetical protein
MKRWWTGCISMVVGLLAVGCSDDPVYYPTPEEGTCKFAVDGDTVDHVEVSAVLQYNGSTIYLSCQDKQPGSVYERMTLTLKAFDGPRIYTIGTDDTLGHASYAGNDEISYSNLSNDPTTGCTIDVEDAPVSPKVGAFVRATFNCNRIEGFREFGTYMHVNLTEGMIEGKFEP